MYLIERCNGQKHPVKVDRVEDEDYKSITKKRYFFNWKTEKENDVYKLVLNDDILGLISLINIKEEKRIEINLLAVSIENRGSDKQYDRIAGTLIAYVCKETMKCYAEEAFVSLVPKTRLKKVYMDKYGMLEAGRHVCLGGQPMLNILIEYKL